MMHRPSLAAFAADVTRFAGTLLAAAVLGDYVAENRKLRAAHRDLYLENAVLKGECDALAAMADDFARQVAMSQHPSAGEPVLPEALWKACTPVSIGEFADAMAVLDSDDLSADDLIWQWGEGQ